MDATLLEISIIVVLALGITATLFFLFKGRSGENRSVFLLQQQLDALRLQFHESLASNTSLVNQQLSQVSQQLNTQLNSISEQFQTTSGHIGNRLDHAARVVGEVRQNLGELNKATERIFEIGKDIAGLQEILRAPKLRGILGELFLEELLNQLLPPDHFSLQHKFKSGEMVDAVIRLGPGLVSVDAKFPLENFKRIVDSKTEEERKIHKRKFNSDLKKHIDAIASKYILPDEGTFPFALMYLPAENVYYETIIKDEGITEGRGIGTYALTRKVIPVSPHSFYAYLQAIVLGLKGLRIEHSAKAIISHLERLQGDFERFRKEYETLGTHLSNAKGKYDEGEKKLNRVQERISTVGELPLPGQEKETNHLKAP